MKQIMVFNFLLVITVSLDAQTSSYTPAPGVVESSMFSASKDGRESSFFITANMTGDSAFFIELVFSNQAPLAEQVADLNAGLFKSALRSIDTNRFQYLHIRHLAQTADLTQEINNSYFSRFQKNPEDSLQQRLETYLVRSSLYKELSSVLAPYHLKIDRIEVKNPKIMSSPNKLKGKNQDKLPKQIDAGMYFYLKQETE